ncbi:hypothetical protein [Streptosporangium sp. NPDC023615]|uniref:hypothetical protein n=1 Tax=Streptosporangium sp. NPDC023615 TaxID=3154794 RepID=UPI0034194E66
MRIRVRVLAVGVVATAALALTGGVASAAPAGRTVAGTTAKAMDYWQYHGHYGTRDECVAVAAEYLWPHNPGGADDYRCQAKSGGWDLWLIFAT